MSTHRSAPQPSDGAEGPALDADDRSAGAAESAGSGTPAAATPSDGIDLSALSVAGITRRRVGWAAAMLLAAWIVVIFARQAGDAAGASNRAEQIASDNAALAAEVASLERELRMIQQPTYIEQQARAYNVGSAQEIPFSLDPSVPDPGPDAPGSASVRIGAQEDRPTPLESWLSLLFGPAD